MQYTTNYNLRKPEDSDYYDIADQNANMDTLDSEIKQIENSALTTSSAINYTTPDSYTTPASGNNIPTLFGRITKGLSDLFTNLAAKLDSSKIIASTNITQTGYVMDGKTCADALTQLNSNIRMKYTAGTRCGVFIISDIVIIRISATGLTANNNELYSDIVLPPGVSLKNNESAYIITPLMSNAWVPNGIDVYMDFSSGRQSPILRFTDKKNVSNCVIIGCFTFPASLFDITT